MSKLEVSVKIYLNACQYRKMPMNSYYDDKHTADQATRAPSLREQRRQDTRLDITHAALELFELKGSSATTVDEISRQAGVSPSTFFRYFPTKEDAILSADLQYEQEIFDWLAAAHEKDVTLAGIETVFENALGRFARSSPRAQDRALRSRRLLNSDAHLRSTAFATECVRTIRVIEAVAAASKLDPSDSLPHAQLLVSSAMTTVRIAFDAWAERVGSGLDADITEIYRSIREDLRKIVLH